MLVNTIPRLPVRGWRKGCRKSPVKLNIEPKNDKSLCSLPATGTLNSDDGLRDYFGKMVKTRSGHDSSQRDGAKGVEESPLSQDCRSSLVENDRECKGPKDYHSLGLVKHDKDSNRFILDLGNNRMARIDYKPIGENIIELYHTEVPIELRGLGIGKVLAKGALECTAEANYKLEVTCEYLEDYVRRFADEKHKRMLDH